MHALHVQGVVYNSVSRVLLLVRLTSRTNYLYLVAGKCSTKLTALQAKGCGLCSEWTCCLRFARARTLSAKDPCKKVFYAIIAHVEAENVVDNWCDVVSKASLLLRKSIFATLSYGEFESCPRRSHFGAAVNSKTS